MLRFIPKCGRAALTLYLFLSGAFLPARVLALGPPADWYTEAPAGGICGYGNVGKTLVSGTEDVLFVNGSVRSLTTFIGSEVEIKVKQPPPNFISPSHFAIYGMADQPLLCSPYRLPFDIGSMCFAPCHLQPGTPGLFTLTNNFGPDICGQLLPSSPAPWTVKLPDESLFPTTITLQGIIEETPGVLRVTNTLRITILNKSP